ncbi:hypothetical protein AOB60_19535 [Streptomyces noursei]|uniref:Uncharacterized protein n=1 Tax=Streptomyces noursei TaxID=1971 RepID=A0A2N8PNL4_STRNR|nr:hypothetical protein AOB60_19535 [Streptomyces noursei]
MVGFLRADPRQRQSIEELGSRADSQGAHVHVRAPVARYPATHLRYVIPREPGTDECGPDERRNVFHLSTCALVLRHGNHEHRRFL